MNIALTVSSEHWVECPSKCQNVSFFAKYHLLNLDKNKNDHFQRHRKTTKIMFFTFGFFYRNHHCKTKSRHNFTVKFSPCLSLEVPFLVLSRFQGWAAAFCSSASWPCHQFQHYNCIACWEIARIFDRVRSFPHFFHVYTKSTATPTYHRNSALVAISSGRKFQNML